MPTAAETKALDELEKHIERYAADPAAYFTERLRVKELWQGQLDILALIPRAMREHKPIWVSSGHALGKDFLDGGLPLWWQETRYPAKTIITGPTDRQVKEIVWNELETHYHRAEPSIPIGGRLLKGKLEWNQEHFILAFTTSDSKSSIGRAQGFHSPNVLILVTEGQAIEEGIYDQLDGLTTSANTLMIVMGNPLTATGRYARALRDTTNNLVVHMDCEDSPNVRARRELIPGMCSYEWVEDKRRRWFDKDPNHPLWLSKVKGRLPLTSVNTVFSADACKAAIMTRPVVIRKRMVTLGLDPAAFGDDETAFCVMESGIPKQLDTTSKQEPTATAGRAIVLANTHSVQLIGIDTDGLGEGVASMLREAQAQQRGQATWRVMGFKGSESPSNERSEYVNKRAEAWFYVAREVTEGRVALPDDDSLLEELCEVLYFYNSRGKIQLEKKEDVKERLGRSPDRADAFIISVYMQQFCQDQGRRERYPDMFSTRYEEAELPNSYMVA